MSIYSANRSGSVALSSVKANESYKSNDLGRILYESQVNDMTVFESILASDFREIKGLQEGTLLRSEISALNEASAKEIFAKLKDRLKAFWEKIKGAIKAAMRKISAYILRDGKAFAENYKAFAAKQKNVKVTKVKTTLPDFDLDINVPGVNYVESLINKYKNDASVDKKSVIGSALAKAIGENGSYTPQEFRTHVNGMAGKEGEISTGDTAAINEMLSYLENASQAIKDMKDHEKTMERIIKEVGNSIKNAEAKLNKNGDGDKNTDVIANITVLTSACETIVSTICSSVISVIKLHVKYSRTALGKIMSEAKKNTVNEAADFAAEDEVDAALEEVPGDDLDPETSEAVDELIASVN